MTREDAQRLVERALANRAEASRGTECVVLEESTKERYWGWVFSYQSKKYVETGDPFELICGTGPFLVNRYTREVRELKGNRFSIEQLLEEYESKLENDT